VNNLQGNSRDFKAIAAECPRCHTKQSVRSSITGHSVKDMDDRYNRVDDEDKREAIGKFRSFSAKC
jgi:hypothetical protein